MFRNFEKVFEVFEKVLHASNFRLLATPYPASTRRFRYSTNREAASWRQVRFYERSLVFSHARMPIESFSESACKTFVLPKYEIPDICSSCDTKGMLMHEILQLVRTSTCRNAVAPVWVFGPTDYTIDTDTTIKIVQSREALREANTFRKKANKWRFQQFSIYQIYIIHNRHTQQPGLLTQGVSYM